MFSKKALSKLIIPLILEQMLGSAIGIVDSLMVSSIGESAISGISLVDSINTLLFTLFSALSSGGAIVAAHYLGKKEYDNAKTAASHLIFFSTALAAVLGIIALFGNYWLIRLFFGNISYEVMKNARIYFFVSAFSFPMIALYNANASIFRIMANSKISLLASLSSNILHVVGNLVFLYVFHMGVAGVAISTLISRIIAALFLSHLLRKPNQPIFVDFKRLLRFDSSIMKRILNLGVPSGIESSIFQIGKLIVAGITSSLGTSAIAANSVASTITSFSTIPGNAIGIAIITVIGQTYGSNDVKQTKAYAKSLIKLTYAIMLGLNIVLYFAAPFLAELYQLEEQTIQTVILLLKFYSIACTILWPLAFALPNALRAVSEVKFTMVISIASMWICRIIFSYVLGIYMGFGIIGVWIGMSIDWLCRAIWITTRFFYGKWQREI